MESKEHINLVNLALGYIKTVIPKENYSLIQTDSTGEISSARVIGGYIPDIYYKFQNLMIIGEAKTVDDFGREHSKKQFEAYYNECVIHASESILVIAVPWNTVPEAKNYFKKLKKNLKQNDSVKVIIINELGRCFEV